MTSGRLCGRIGSLAEPDALADDEASARPAAPALMWTAVPPAKSIGSTCAAEQQPVSLLAIQPPVSRGQ